MSKTEVAILGATGTVGQKAIALLEKHHDFNVAQITASPANAGKRFGETVNWREKFECPLHIKEMYLQNPLEINTPVAISALPAEQATEIEPALAKKGIHVFSNASAMRMNKDVPLIIPEINREDISLARSQKTPGKIITNPNCATVFLCLGLAPLMESFTVEHIHVTTLQGLSGAGYPGVPSMDIIGNSIPCIPGEEAKIVTETRKIMKRITRNNNYSLTANVNRVPVPNGHTIVIQAHCESNISPEDLLLCFKKWQIKFPGLYVIYNKDDSPQPGRDLTDSDQRVHIGRIRQGGTSNIISLISMGHNLVRGAAGAAITNMETCLSQI